MFLPVQAHQVFLVALEREIYRAKIWGCTVHPNMNKNGWPAHCPGEAWWPVRTNDRYPQSKSVSCSSVQNLN